MEVADVHFRELPFERGRFDAQVTKGADGHVAADAGETVEVKNAHAM
jgi:hypothetical protein